VLVTAITEGNVLIHKQNWMATTSIIRSKEVWNFVFQCTSCAVCIKASWHNIVEKISPRLSWSWSFDSLISSSHCWPLSCKEKYFSEVFWFD